MILSNTPGSRVSSPEVTLDESVNMTSFIRRRISTRFCVKAPGVRTQRVASLQRELYIKEYIRLCVVASRHTTAQLQLHQTVSRLQQLLSATFIKRTSECARYV